MSPEMKERRLLRASRHDVATPRHRYGEAENMRPSGFDDDEAACVV